jgi:type II secretory pathway pseudopilin PulG
MRILLVVLMLVISASAATAQDPGMQAAQQQAMVQAQIDAQLAQQNVQQNMQQAQQQALQSDFPVCCTIAAKPKFSVKSGTYDSPQKVKITDSARGAIIYYTTDGWTPTAASNRYLGPITVMSSTLLQAVAIAPRYAYYGRSLVATAQYNIAAPAGTTTSAEPNSPSGFAAPFSADGKLTLAQGTPVPFVFGAEVSSKTASVGDQIPLVLAADLTVGNVVVAPKGSPAAALVI